jgi:hypothetical protein
LAREKLANMAETWIKLAIQLEDQMALLEQGEVRLGSPSKAGS